MRKGDIWWATLEEPRGSEPGYRRPVVVISSNEFNESKLKSIIVAVITSNLRLAQAPGKFHLSRKKSGLSRDSVANVSQLLTLDKSFLTERVGRLPPKKLLSLSLGLKLALSL